MMQTYSDVTAFVVTELLVLFDCYGLKCLNEKIADSRKYLDNKEVFLSEQKC